MPRTCSVINCSNRSNRDKVKFYRFPSIRSAQRVVEEARVARRAQWVAALRRIDFDRVNINYTYICSEHFISGKPSDNPTNPDYVPSQNMGYDSQTTSDGSFKMMKFNRSRKKAQEKKALSLRNSLRVTSHNESTNGQWVPTGEWVHSWKSKLPLQTIMRLLQVLVPQVEKICIDKGLTDESEILKFLQHGTLVGLLPVPHPILIRKYQANSGTTTWFRTYMWGVIYLRNMDPPIWYDTDVKLFEIQRV